MLTNIYTMMDLPNATAPSCEKVMASLTLLDASEPEMNLFINTLESAILGGRLMDTFLDYYPDSGSNLLAILGGASQDDALRDPSFPAPSPAPSESPTRIEVPAHILDGGKDKGASLAIGWIIALSVIGCLICTWVAWFCLFMSRQEKLMNLQHVEYKSEQGDSEQGDMSQRETEEFNLDSSTDNVGDHAKNSNNEAGKCAQIGFTYPSQGIATPELTCH